MPKYKKVPSIKRDKNGKYPMTRDQKIHTAEEFEKPKYMIATKAYHQLGELSREYQELSTDNLCVITKEIDEGYVGSWITGFGFVNVTFPKETTRELTSNEKEHFNKLYFRLASHPPHKLNIE